MTTPGRLMLVGYGNSLRGDDAAGVLLAEKISEAHPALKVVTAHQLLPELAAELAGVTTVIFADAAIGLSRPRWRYLHDDKQTASWCGGHLQSPAQILSWARLLDIPLPRAWWLQLPAISFELGQPPSDLARLGIELAISQLNHFLAEVLTT